MRRQARRGVLNPLDASPPGSVWWRAVNERLLRELAYAVIVPRLQRLYEWSADELADPRVLGLVRDGNPIYAWPFEERHVWRSRHMPFATRVLEHVTHIPYSLSPAASRASLSLV